MPLPTRSSADPAARNFSALDHLTIAEVAGHAGNMSRQLDAIPRDFHEAWAAANVLVIDAIRNSGPDNELEEVRALKMLLILPSILLRKQPAARGGPQGRLAAARLLASRFERWGRGDFGSLDADWARDCAQEAQQRNTRRTRPANPERDIKATVALLAKGKFSDAAKLLQSHGLADIADPVVLQQMLTKHPLRRTAVPPVIPGLADTDRLVVGLTEMEESYRGLKTDKAQGASPWRYEYLIPLAPAEPFVGDAARHVLVAHAWLASSFANGDLPPWFYFVFCAARCVPLRKCAAQAGVAESARPIGISCALRRGLTKGVFLNKGLRGEIEEYLFPQQLGVLVSAGGTKLIFGAREVLENPSFCIAGSDIYNAFNEGDRAEMIARTLASSPGLAPLARLFNATLAPKYQIFVSGKGGGLVPMGRDGESGVAQGSVEGGVAFAISIHPELQALDAELRPHGGCARAGHDDVRAVGPPWVVFPAMQRFHDALERRLGLVVQPSKCECWIDEAHINSLDEHRGEVQRSHLLDGVTPHYGVMCYGVPIGSEEYTKLALAGKCDEIASISSKLINTLGSSHKQQLWLLTLFSTARKFEYFARHCYPDHSRDACTRFDAIIHEQATHALGVSLDHDRFATARLALPRRYRGAGLRKMADVAPAAFCGAMVQAVPSFLDVWADAANPASDVTQRGMLELPQVVAAVGRNSFVDMQQHGWRAYLRPRTPPMLLPPLQGQAFRSCWLALQLGAGIVAGEEPNGDRPTRVLHLSPEEAWPTERMDADRLFLNMQKDITEDAEAHRFDVLKTQINALPRGDRAVHLFRSLDRNSSAWVAALPGGYGLCTTGEWVEITARYFGVESPICAGLAARGARLFGHDIDAYGDNLVAATGAGVIGGHIAKYRHDPFLALLAELARRVGAYARTEAGDIFGSVLAAHPAAFHLYWGGVGRRPAPTVDLYAEYDFGGGRARPRMFELKTIAFCKTRYRDTDGRYPHGAVGRRADTLPGERLNELIKIDRDIFRTPAGQTGPMEARALTFCPPGGVPFTPLVVGSFGEMSLEVGAFVGDLASMGAHALRGCLGAPSVKLARAALLWKMRQELGMCALRGHAKVIIERARLENVGGRGAAHFGADDDGGAEAWGDGAHHQRQESRSWHE
jgi:hypothetical protein